MTDRRLQPLTLGESVALLASTPVGRVVFTERALPAVLPVTFIVDGDTVVLRTARGSRLARAAAGGVLAFEVDELHAGNRTGWSVVVTGQARVEEDVEEVDRLSGLLEPWVPGIRDVFVRIPLTLVTGRRIEVLPGQYRRRQATAGSALSTSRTTSAAAARPALVAPTVLAEGP